MEVGDEESNNNNKEKNNIQNYGTLISIWQRMDESYWTSFNMFLIVEGLLLAGYSQVIDIKYITKISFYSIIYSIAGISISILWWYVLHKKMAFTYIAEETARDIEEKTFKDIEKGGFFQRTKYMFHGRNINIKKIKNFFKDIDTNWLIQRFGMRKTFTIFPSSFVIGFVFPFLLLEIWVIMASIELTKISILQDNNNPFILFIIGLSMIFVIIYIPSYFMNKEYIKSHVWYAGYGSNLDKQRFLCYINGGQPTYGNISNTGYPENKTLPDDEKQYKIKYRLYFALPSGKSTSMWGLGGIAFINPTIEKTKEYWTKGRIWKITKDQYKEIWNQEGKNWYGKEILLGKKNGIPILTITNPNKLTKIFPPSESYIKTIIRGLKESYNIDNNDIISYLIKIEGIRNNYTEEQLINIIQQVQ